MRNEESPADGVRTDLFRNCREIQQHVAWAKCGDLRGACYIKDSRMQSIQVSIRG